MRRTIIQQADLSDEALTDLKDWLSISRNAEDPMLINLIEASLALCEAFIDQAPLEQTIEEYAGPFLGRVTISARPVQRLVSIELIAQDGNRSAIDPANYSFTIDASNKAELTLKQAFEGQSIAVRMVVGIAPDWNAIPAEIRQGVIRMAAHYYRSRDQENAPKRSVSPPASVAALWRPWRAVRLA